MPNVNLDPKYLWEKSPVRFSTSNRIKAYIKDQTNNNPGDEQQRALSAWKKFASQIIVGTHLEKHRNKRREYRYNFPGHKNGLYGADLFDIFGDRRTEISKFNDGYKYILTFINSLTKYAHAVPIKSREGPDIRDALEGIFKKENLSCSPFQANLQVDEEFKAMPIRNMARKYCVHIYSSQSDWKSSIVERFNRTLRDLLVKRIETFGTERWLPLLDDALYQYNNNMVHRTTGMTPVEAEQMPNKAWLRILEDYNKKSRIKPFKFQVGELVRVMHKRDNIFRKGALRKFTAKVFIIFARRHVINANIYYLKDDKDRKIQGSYNEKILSHAERDIEYRLSVVKQQGNRALVHYDGFSDSDDEWRDVNEIHNVGLDA